MMFSTLEKRLKCVLIPLRGRHMDGDWLLTPVIEDKRPYWRRFENQRSKKCLPLQRQK
ncbi:MAG: hypothetical protein KAS32_24105 [Candidatus Peribacteraceae bacterium]|nr:hypothetical protein [Candidatus Peribacteraceae bacterium]